MRRLSSASSRQVTKLVGGLSPPLPSACARVPACISGPLFPEACHAATQLLCMSFRCAVQQQSLPAKHSSSCRCQQPLPPSTWSMLSAWQCSWWAHVHRTALQHGSSWWTGRCQQLRCCQTTVLCTWCQLPPPWLLRGAAMGCQLLQTGVLPGRALLAAPVGS